MRIHAREQLRARVLVITADNDARRMLAACYKPTGGGYPAAERIIQGYLQDYLQVLPEEVGALTASPIFCRTADYVPRGAGTMKKDAPLWWFPNYQITDPWRKLASKGRVEFEGGAR